MDSVAADAPGGGALSVENVVISTPTGSVIADVSGSGALSLEGVVISATRDVVAADAPGCAPSPQGLAIAVATKMTATTNRSASRCDSPRRRTGVRVGPLPNSPDVSGRAATCSSFIEAQDRVCGLRVKSPSGTARPHSRALPRDSRPCLDSQFAGPGWPGSAAERLGAGRAESPMRLVRRLPSR